MAAPRRLALLLEYDGTGFAGSQAQDAQRTVQGVLEDAWREFTGERLRVAFAGRTDAGAHARGQVAALHTATDHDTPTVRRALNHFLPEDVAVRAAAEVSADFDPRRDAVSRTYRYTLEDGAERSPLGRRHSWQLWERLDCAAFAAAAAALPKGEQDWAAFAGPVPSGYSTVRTLSRLEARRRGPRRLEVTMEASGFLPHQVRRTVGALVRVGAGKMDAPGFSRLLGGPPGSVGPTAPAQGLTLRCVRYPRGFVDWDDGDERRRRGAMTAESDDD